MKIISFNGKILKNIYHFEKISSTNTYALENNLKNGTVILADYQEEGRGRYRRKWESKKGGLWFSIVLRKKITYPYIYVMLVSISIIEVLEREFKIKLKIKWPNDIFFENKKLSGILIENDIFNRNFVIGIGININNPVSKFKNYSAVSLKRIIKKTIKKEKILLKILKRIDLYISNLKKYKDKLIKKWVQKQDNLEGKIVKIIKNKKIINVKIKKISKIGEIFVEEKGKIKKLGREIFFI